MNFWKDKKVLITGGYGFLGSHIVDRLKDKVKQLILPVSRYMPFEDLRIYNNCLELTEGIDLVIHCAGVVGGIGANDKYAGQFFYDNIIMGVQLVEACRINKVKKFVGLGTLCEYPKWTPIPFKEENLWSGYPEETNAPYALAKKMLLVQCQAYRKQYGFNGIHLMPLNLYGCKDNFDLESSHVIPALIRKCLESKDELVVWGTGTPSRGFLYVDDCVEAIILASEFYDKPEPINIGSDMEITIRLLVELIAKLTDFKGKIIFDKTKPDGQPRRCLDTSKAYKEFGWKATTGFEEGLKKTIEWYKRNKI